MPRYAVLATHSTAQPAPEAGSVSAVVQFLDAGGQPEGPPAPVFGDQLPRAVADVEARGLRWVWERTADWYPALLQAGASVARAHDIALSRGILRHSQSVTATPYLAALRADAGTEPAAGPGHALPPAFHAANQSALFEPPRGDAGSVESLAGEMLAQLRSIPETPAGRRLQLLLAAESAGALIAAEMRHQGIPWRRDVHAALLEEQLGPRAPAGVRPPRLEELAGLLREALGAPHLNPDSPQDLLRALHRAGIETASTRQWELEEFNHPAIEPLVRYKKLSRLLTANGWAWLDAWVADGRFRPEYVVGGVVTGRWASRGGGALQIPHGVRTAVRADAGRVLVVADAAQLEPRILAALAGDEELAEAARGRDLYQGIADRGFGGDRASAKVAVLGAMYGATTGDAGRLVPQLAKAFPRAVRLVEDAARHGESGGTVSSFLGRCSPPPDEAWLRSQRSSTAEEQRRADRAARDRGRFTRNFVVQSTAAEWALCWLGELRRRLRAEQATGRDPGELVFFLHDEVMLHVPEPAAQTAVELVQEAAAEASRLLFGRIPIEFPVGVSVVQAYADAK